MNRWWHALMKSSDVSVHRGTIDQRLMIEGDPPETRFYPCLEIFGYSHVALKQLRLCPECSAETYRSVYTTRPWS